MGVLAFGRVGYHPTDTPHLTGNPSPSGEETQGRNALRVLAFGLLGYHIADTPHLTGTPLLVTTQPTPHLTGTPLGEETQGRNALGVLAFGLVGCDPADAPHLTGNPLGTRQAETHGRFDFRTRWLPPSRHATSHRQSVV
eukprot:2640978-Pyramimonas_sp.AAC.1